MKSKNFLNIKHMKVKKANVANESKQDNAAGRHIRLVQLPTSYYFTISLNAVFMRDVYVASKHCRSKT